MPNPAQPIEIVLTTLTYGGEAIGRYAGKAVFVPFALPGETVRARIVEEHKNFARAELLEVRKPSPERIQPRCAHYTACGGCHYQHLPYAAQLKIKADILRDQLSRIGKIPAPPVTETVASPLEWQYRNHVQFHLDLEGRLGFVSSAFSPSPDLPLSVLPITECHLPESDLNTLWPTLQFEPDSPIERVSLRAGDELMLILESDVLEPPEMELETDLSVVHLVDDDAVVLAGDDYLVIPVLGRPFRVSAASFFQVNTAMAEKMVSHVLALAPQTAGTILDVYCGVGLFSAFLAPRCQRLVAIELSESSCADFAANLDEFEHVELYEAAAEEVLPTLAGKVDFAVVDPPRAGLDRQALDALLALKPEKLVYVSCDPSTLARDARRLVDGGYRLEQVTPFDLFPQTYHIESISVFQR